MPHNHCLKVISQEVLMNLICNIGDYTFKITTTSPRGCWITWSVGWSLKPLNWINKIGSLNFQITSKFCRHLGISAIKTVLHFRMVTMYKRQNRIGNYFEIFSILTNVFFAHWRFLCHSMVYSRHCGNEHNLYNFFPLLHFLCDKSLISVLPSDFWVFVAKFIAEDVKVRLTGETFAISPLHTFAYFRGGAGYVWVCKQERLPMCEMKKIRLRIHKDCSPDNPSVRGFIYYQRLDKAAVSIGHEWIIICTKNYGM